MINRIRWRKVGTLLIIAGASIIAWFAFTLVATMLLMAVGPFLMDHLAKPILDWWANLIGWEYP